MALIINMDGGQRHPQGQDICGDAFNSEKIWTFWEGQKHHVRYIQDPAGAELHVYKCARGQHL